MNKVLIFSDEVFLTKEIENKFKTAIQFAINNGGYSFYIPILNNISEKIIKLCNGYRKANSFISVKSIFVDEKNYQDIIAQMDFILCFVNLDIDNSNIQQSLLKFAKDTDVKVYNLFYY